MNHYRATRLSDNYVEEYDAASPDWLTYPQEEWTQSVVVVSAGPPPGAPVDTRMYGGRRTLTKLEFIELIGTDAYKAILSLAKQSVDIEAWVEMVKLSTPDEEGNSIDLDSPRVQVGIPEIGTALVAQGVVDADWVAGVLNG